MLVVYYESIKRELNKRLIFECRCDARLKKRIAINGFYAPFDFM